MLLQSKGCVSRAQEAGTPMGQRRVYASSAKRGNIARALVRLMRGHASRACLVNTLRRQDRVLAPSALLAVLVLVTKPLCMNPAPPAGIMAFLTKRVAWHAPKESTAHMMDPLRVWIAHEAPI